jgi:hypothetical protein
MDWSNSDDLTGSVSGRARVLVDEAVEPLPTHEHAAFWDRLGLGRAEAQGAMWPGPVVVVEVLAQDLDQVALAEDDQPAQTLSPRRAQYPLAGGIRPRGVDGCADALDAEPRDPVGEVCAVDAIAVMDQVDRVLASGRGLDHLAPDPGGGRVSGQVEVEQAAAAVADQEEDVEGPEGQGLDHEQVCCPDGLGLVGEEGTPTLAGRPSWPAASVVADGAGDERAA